MDHVSNTSASGPQADVAGEKGGKRESERLPPAHSPAFSLSVPRAPSTGETFRQRALAEIDRVRWIPDWGVNRIRSAVQSRPDWCISRQRSWGVSPPALFVARGRGSLHAPIVRNAADLIEQHGSNVWFEKSVAELWSLLKPKNWGGPEAVAKSTDTLDVWI